MAAIKHAEHVLSLRGMFDTIKTVDQQAGGEVAVQGEPVAWMRKWTHDGEEPQKTRNENGRMAWPLKFKLHPVTEMKCLSDDVPLYAPLPNPPKEQSAGGLGSLDDGA